MNIKIVVVSSVRPLLCVSPNRNFKIERGEFMYLPMGHLPAQAFRRKYLTHCEIKNQNQITKWQFLPPSGRPVEKEENKLERSGEWKDVRDTASSCFKITKMNLTKSKRMSVL
jgi:hypothetical protein